MTTVRAAPVVALTISRSMRSCLRGSRCTASESAPTHCMRATYCPVSGPTASQRVAPPSIPITPTVTRELGAPAFG